MDYLPVIEGVSTTFRAGRCVYEGYQRGWGLEYGELVKSVSQDEDYCVALRYAMGRTIVSPLRLMNLFLLIKFFLPRLSFGHIIEFGAYRGGSAFFMGSLAQKFLPNTNVYALDTFGGMPPTDRTIDAHKRGDFSETELREILAARQEYGLGNVHFIAGLFSDTVPTIMPRIGKIALAHIDCDIYEAVKDAYLASKNYIIPHGYYVFDDAPSSSCIGANEAVEELVIRRDNLFSEQSFPHYVFRAPD